MKLIQRFFRSKRKIAFCDTLVLLYQYGPNACGNLGSVQLRSAWMPLRLLYSHCHTSNRNVQGRTQCKCLIHTQKHPCESPSPTAISWFTPWLRHKLNCWSDTESAHISSVPFSPTEESMLPVSSGHKLAKEEGPGALRFIQRFVP